MESFVPIREPGGGGFSIMQLNLRALYDEYVHARNYWTKGNCGLPLTRYSGCNIKFYRSNDTDYLVRIHNTGPFEVTLESYLNTQPSRMIMDKKVFIVPKLNPNKQKRPYIRKKIKPPALLQNKWYFQQDILNTPLVMITTTSCSFDQMFAPNDEISTNITFLSLNTNMFQNPLWETDDNAPYYCKVVGTNNTALFTYFQNDLNSKTDWKYIQPLFNTRHYKAADHTTAQQITSVQEFENHTKWANPFSLNLETNHEEQPVYYGTPPTATNNKFQTKPNILLTEIFQECRYNPFKDKGTGNKVYIKSTNTFQGSMLSLPTDKRLLIEDLPLWLILWGWPSWLEKSKPVYHLKEDYQLVFQSPYIYPPLPCYVPLDYYFTNPKPDILNETDKQHWHPKFEYQSYTLAKIAETGPMSPKINKQKQIQTHLFYQFYFKWGGCPAPMEQICDPATQEKFPNPNNILQEFKIENPETPKEYYIYRFDERHEQLTEPAAKRLKKDFTSTKYFTEFGSKDPLLEIQPPTEQTQKKTPEKEKENEEIIQQLQLVREHQEQLLLRIHRLTKLK